MTNIDDILEDLYVSTHGGKTFKDDSDNLDLTDYMEAKQQLSQLIDGIIGEQEIIIDYANPASTAGRNNLRVEQRQRAKEAGFDL